MELCQGQIVAHPHHGPARVIGFMMRTVAGKPRRYATLQVIHTNLEVSMPVDSADEIGVRPLFCAQQLQQLFGVLAGPSGYVEEAWSRRFKDEATRFRSGDLLKVAGVVRDLTRRQCDKGLSQGEKELLRDAKQPLINELAICLETDEDAVSELIDAAVLDGMNPVESDGELAAS